MSDHSQKQEEEERFYLEAFLNLLGLEVIQINRGNPDPPDWVITDGAGRRIGVEVTMYHDNTPTPCKHTRCQVEKAWDELLEEIRRTILARPETGRLYGYLTFKALVLPKSSEQRQFVAELRQCVLEYSDQLPARICDFRNYSCLNMYLCNLRLKKVKCKLSWECNLRTAWIGLNSSMFVELVSKKAEDLAKIKVANVDEYWLLVVSGPEMSQNMGPRVLEHLRELNEADGIMSQSKFRKAYVFQYALNTICEWPAWHRVM